MVFMCGLITTMTTHTKQYDTLSEFHADLNAWVDIKKFHEVMNIELPPEPVWNPSPNYIEIY